MEQAKSLELEILLTLRNQKSVRVHQFHELFEDNWNLYRAKFNELIISKFIKVSTLTPSICVFELSTTGEDRLRELVTEHAGESGTRTATNLIYLNHTRRTERWQGRHRMDSIAIAST